MAYTTIDDPSAYFQTALYSSTGGGGSITVTNDGNSDLQPDWIWIKVRNGANDHNMFDSSRSNFAERQWSNLSSASDSTVSVSANSDGFATGTGYGDINNTSGANNYVAWQWKANGGTTTTNDASSTGVGSVDSVYQVNSTSKFGIMTYTATNDGNITVAHGLGSAPKLVMTKTRNQAWGWFVWSHALANTHGLQLHHANGSGDSSDALGDTDPSSTIFTMGNTGNANNNYQAGDTVVAYYWDEVQGYSKFGSYTGNGDADGTFVYTGFKPAFLIQKQTNANGEYWMMKDNAREPFNPVDANIYPNAANAEGDTNGVDFLSNGFKCRTNGAGSNGSGNTYFYIAFAESPFVSSEGVPATAR